MGSYSALSSVGDQRYESKAHRNKTYVASFPAYLRMILLPPGWSYNATTSTLSALQINKHGMLLTVQKICHIIHFPYTEQW